MNMSSDVRKMIPVPQLENFVVVFVAGTWGMLM